MLTQSWPGSELLDQFEIEVFDLGMNFLGSVDCNLWLWIIESNFLFPVIFKVVADLLNLLMEFLFHLFIALKSFLWWHFWRFWIGNICVVLFHRKQPQHIEIRLLTDRLLVALSEVRGGQSRLLSLVACQFIVGGNRAGLHLNLSFLFWLLLDYLIKVGFHLTD